MSHVGAPAVVGGEDRSGCVFMESVAVRDITVLSTARSLGVESGVERQERINATKGRRGFKIPTEIFSLARGRAPAKLLGGMGLSASEIPDLPDMSSCQVT